MQPRPEGIWGMPPEILYTLPGYNPDGTRANRSRHRRPYSRDTGEYNFAGKYDDGEPQPFRNLGRSRCSSCC
jgi:hypothetical protein